MPWQYTCKECLMIITQISPTKGGKCWFHILKEILKFLHPHTIIQIISEFPKEASGRKATGMWHGAVAYQLR